MIDVVTLTFLGGTDVKWAIGRGIQLQRLLMGMGERANVVFRFNDIDIVIDCNALAAEVEEEYFRGQRDLADRVRLRIEKTGGKIGDTGSADPDDR